MVKGHAGLAFVYRLSEMNLPPIRLALTRFPHLACSPILLAVALFCSFYPAHAHAFSADDGTAAESSDGESIRVTSLESAPSSEGGGGALVDATGPASAPVSAEAGSSPLEPDEPQRRWARNYFAIAAGAASVPSYSGSNDRVIIPGLFIRGRVHGYAFSSRGTNLQVDVIRQLRGQRIDWKLGPIINVRGERTGRIGDAQVAALGKRDLAVEAGLVAGVSASGIITSQYDNLGFRIVALRDVSGQHGSWVVSPTLEYGTPLSRRVFIGLSASINITGRGYGRYYYDIDAAGSAASGLPQFNRAGSRATVGKATLGLAGAYALSGDLRRGWVAVAGAQYGRMTGRLAQSPIVRIAGDRDQLLGGAGLAYQF